MFTVFACLSLSRFCLCPLGSRSGVAVSGVKSGLWLLDLPCVVVGLDFLMSDRVVSALEVACELFLVEPDHKEQIIGEAKITGFCLSV
ncbi:unnamed protein product [Brassica oleracea var. botrytis]